MTTQILIIRRERVSRLTKLAQKDKNTCKIFQGYRLLSWIDKQIAQLTDTKNLFKY